MFIRQGLFIVKYIKHVRNLSSKRHFKEISVKVPWGQIAGKWWEPFDTRPILAIHGWQDNCQSFDRLIPFLNRDVSFLAIDLPGHGYSSRIPPGLYYHYMIYILTIRGVSNYFGWPKLSLMGHSMGAIVSYLYSSLYHSELDFLICLDAMKPTQMNLIPGVRKAVEVFSKNDEFVRNAEEPPSYTIEEIKQKTSEPIENSILLEYTHFLMERNIAPSKKYPGKFYFTRDPRLKASVLFHIRDEELIQNIPQMNNLPILFMKASESPYFDDKKLYQAFLESNIKNNVNFKFHRVEGRHHVHLNHPERVAPTLNDFIKNFNVEDRSQGKYRSEIEVSK